eukprot:6712488-Prymnesium_polylepis.1
MPDQCHQLAALKARTVLAKYALGVERAGSEQWVGELGVPRTRRGRISATYTQARTGRRATWTAQGDY